jgi:hypothetical protein
MAKLIITLPRTHWIESVLWTQGNSIDGVQILIDGRLAAAIALGERIALELPTGRHNVRARHSFLRSQPIDIDATLEETHRIAVGPASRWQNLNWLSRAFVITTTTRCDASMSRPPPTAGSTSNPTRPSPRRRSASSHAVDDHSRLPTRAHGFAFGRRRSRRNSRSSCSNKSSTLRGGGVGTHASDIVNGRPACRQRGKSKSGEQTRKSL